jgi:hypothetical protein
MNVAASHITTSGPPPKLVRKHKALLQRFAAWSRIPDRPKRCSASILCQMGMPVSVASVCKASSPAADQHGITGSAKQGVVPCAVTSEPGEVMIYPVSGRAVTLLKWLLRLHASPDQRHIRASSTLRMWSRDAGTSSAVVFSGRRRNDAGGPGCQSADT